MTINDLEPGDLLWVEWGYGMSKATYLGDGIFRLGWTPLFGGLDDYYENGRNRRWVFIRKPLWKIIRNYLFKKS